MHNGVRSSDFVASANPMYFVMQRMVSYGCMSKTMSIGENSSVSSSKTMGKRPGKRPGRKPSKIDERAKLERSRQSARECRARKKLRYQYLEELVLNREKAVFALKDELETYKQWCTQLENGGPVPESLVKMLVNEEMAQKRKQMEQARTALAKQQQQQQRQHSQFSSSSSSSLSSTSSTSSESSPPTLAAVAAQNQQHLQAQQYPQQKMMTVQGGPSMQSLSPAQLQQYIPNLSPPLQSQTQPAQQQFVQRQSTVVPTLQRQMAFDFGHQQQRHQSPAVMTTHQPTPLTQPQQLSPAITSVATAVSSSEVKPEPMHEIQQLLQELKRGKMQQQQQRFQNTARLPVATSSQSVQVQRVTQGSLVPHSVGQNFMTRVKSEPPLRYQYSSDKPNPNSEVPMDITGGWQDFSAYPSSEGIRSRSFSNPSTMMALPKPSLNTLTPEKVTSHSLTSRTIGSMPSHSGSHSSVGIFSGSLVGSDIRSASLGMPTPITVEDSSSSDENVSEQHLFQSSLNPQKRTLSDPVLPENPKRSLHTGAQLSPVTTAMGSDPYVTLNNLTSVHCFSATRTSNTPSPAPFGMVPAGIPSPASSRYSTGKSSTPSSSNTPSPAPLSSLSSLLELSASSPAVSTTSDTTTDDSTSVASLAPVQCSSTGLSASISEPIPEWYSFLADLEDRGLSTLNSRQEATSAQNTPLSLTPKQQDQPSTPDPAFMNVPNIIDEILDKDPAL